MKEHGQYTHCNNRQESSWSKRDWFKKIFYLLNRGWEEKMCEWIHND